MLVYCKTSLAYVRKDFGDCGDSVQVGMLYLY